MKSFLLAASLLVAASPVIADPIAAYEYPQFQMFFINEDGTVKEQTVEMVKESRIKALERKIEELEKRIEKLEAASKWAIKEWAL